MQLPEVFIALTVGKENTPFLNGKGGRLKEVHSQTVTFMASKGPQLFVIEFLVFPCEKKCLQMYLLFSQFGPERAGAYG